MAATYVDLPARGEYSAAQYRGRDLTVADSWYPAGLRVPRHAHRGATITAVLGGALEESYAASTIECLTSTIVIRPAGEPHSDAIGRAGVRDLEIDLSDSEASRRFDRLQHVRDERAAGVAAQLGRELAIHDSVRPLAVESLAMELVAIAARWAGAPRFRAPAWLSRAHELIHDRFRDALTVADLAAAAGVHPVHFARVFRNQYGVTPSALIRDLRIRWAAERVRSTRTPLASIAADAGFYDQAHFARAFRKRLGAPPSRFR